MQYFIGIGCIDVILNFKLRGGSGETNEHTGLKDYKFQLLQSFQDYKFQRLEVSGRQAFGIA